MANVNLPLGSDEREAWARMDERFNFMATREYVLKVVFSTIICYTMLWLAVLGVIVK